MKKMLTLMAVLTLLCVGTATGYLSDVNKTIKNKGPGIAYDLTVVLRGSYAVTDTYGGDFQDVNQYFGLYGNRIIRFSNLNGTNDPINYNESVHVGWSTATVYAAPIQDLYWTGPGGSRLGNSSHIEEIASGWRWDPNTNNLTVDWWNVYQDPNWPFEPPIWDPPVDPNWIDPNYPGPWDPNQPGTWPPDITIYDINYMVTDVRVPLADLNDENTSLEWTYLESGTAIPFGSSHEAIIPGIQDGDNVLLRYDVYSPDSWGDSRDFIQFTIPEPATLFLVALGVLAARRRRR